MPRQTVRNLPTALDNQPQPPPRLNDEAKAIWKATIGTRASADWKAGDLALLELFAAAAADVQRQNRMLEKEGEVIENARGRLQANPRISIRNSREQIVMRTLTKLRLTPASRWNSREAARAQRYADESRGTRAMLDGDPLLARKGQLQ